MKPTKAETEAAISRRMVAAGLRVLEESTFAWQAQALLGVSLGRDG